jgi:hypothetical protein
VGKSHLQLTTAFLYGLLTLVGYVQPQRYVACTSWPVPAAFGWFSCWGSQTERHYHVLVSSQLLCKEASQYLASISLNWLRFNSRSKLTRGIDRPPFIQSAVLTGQAQCWLSFPAALYELVQTEQCLLSCRGAGIFACGKHVHCKLELVVAGQLSWVLSGKSRKHDHAKQRALGCQYHVW